MSLTSDYYRAKEELKASGFRLDSNRISRYLTVSLTRHNGVILRMTYDIYLRAFVDQNKKPLTDADFPPLYKD